MMQAVPCLNFPSIMRTPAGDMHRQWAVLDHSSRHGGSFWGDFPPILNDTMNWEVDRLRERHAAHAPFEGLEIRYTWTSLKYSRDTNTKEPIMEECVVDLMKMTQRNLHTGKERAVKFYYQP